MTRPLKSLPLTLLGSSALLLCVLSGWVKPAQAEGSRNLFPNGAPGSRASLEWVANTRYGPTAPVDNSLLRRTLLQVYANAGEYILMGSTAVGVNSGNVVIFNPGTVTGRVGNETIPGTPNYQCSAQRTATGNTNQGRITSRTQELAGPDTITNPLTATRGNQIASGYVPCFYQAPTSGIYYVAFYGPSGGNSTAGGGPTAEIDMINANNFNATQATSTSAWDVTVRSSLTSTTDINGRLFADYLALFTNNNGRPVESDIYMVTKDGYRYFTDLNGLDANGWVMYGNDVGFYDSDGQTPLYHDVVGDSAQLTNLQGGTNFALPTHIIFFSNPMSNAGATEAIAARGIPLVPTAPMVSNASFTGTFSGNTSTQNTGGTFQFSSNVPGSYEIVLSRDGVNFDPTHPSNRRLTGLITTAGIQTIAWDGRDNSSGFFPVGSNYPVRITVRNGEYHFPLIDAENSIRGGPSFTLLNAVNPLGNTTGFYDDRGYRTIGGTIVGTVGTVLCGGSPPNPPNSNMMSGFNMTSTQRAFGTPTGGNTNVSCTGSFGDTKGLDVWTYIPSTAASTSVNIIPNTPDPTIAKSHTGSFTQGGTGTYTITVTNSGGVATSGTVTVADTLPTGLTPTAATGTGWSCAIAGQTVTCTRSDALAALVSYPAITLTVSVAANAPTSVTNTATVSGGNDGNTGNNSSSDPTTITAASATPRILLVKRITAVNGVNITTTVDDPGSTNDNAANWPTPVDATSGISTYLRGATNGGTIKPGDVLEYTIYFLSNGGSPATNINLCDLVPGNSTFIPNSFSSSPESGINLAIGATSTNLTNVPDSDGGQFFNVGATPSVSCSAANTNGSRGGECGQKPRNVTQRHCPRHPE
ncbi:DUF11 domain-containing protein (plasmid) [Kovacikia minuta CCNUW1]|uniref:DUF11 domain-containing protein n=1 Tax=Kovacikia minuta TaxID=2931930 RepID=UPI001CCE6294|nr:DUF11 domain-containing protein [Kovacikia minuta]UBF29979.1 DUF11 domain-containing protein [Kovacikia minuta CCNUW1]